MTRRFLSVAVLTLCAVLAAVVSGLGPAQAQGGDSGYVDVELILEVPDTIQAGSGFEFDIIVVNNGSRTAYDVEVVVDVEYPDLSYVQLFRSDELPVGSTFREGTSLRWTIPELGGLQGEEVVASVIYFDSIDGVIFDKSSDPHEIFGDVTTSSFESYLGNNTDRVWAYNYTLNTNSVREVTGNYTVNVKVDDPVPAPGDTVNFTITADRTKGGGSGGVTAPPIDLEVDIELTGGLTVEETGTITYAPANRADSVIYRSGVRTNGVFTNGVFNIGTLQKGEPRKNSVTLPVTVPTNGDGNKQCLTATLTGNPPPGVGAFDDDISDNVAEVCVGAAPAGEPVVLDSGTVDLFTWYDCVGNSSPPCDQKDDDDATTNDDLQLVAVAGTASVGSSVFQPTQVVVHVPDPGGRTEDANGNLVWSTGFEHFAGLPGSTTGRPGVILARQTELLDLESTIDDDRWGTPHSNTNFAAYETGYVKASVSTPASGKMTIFRNRNNAPTLLWSTAADGVSYENSADILARTPEVGYSSANTGLMYAEFTALGTYEMTLQVAADYDTDVTDSTAATSYEDEETYTFHVGPMAELGVREGEASPDVAAGQYALTVEAVNNGLDVFADAQVTIDLPAGVTVADHIASDGTYANGTWVLGELELADSRRSRGIPEGAELTLILAGAEAGRATATATIANATIYAVCIDDDGDDVDLYFHSETICTVDDATNTWHSTPVYDYDDRNNEVTLTARAGTPGVGSDIPANPRTAIAWGFVAFQWDGMTDGLYGWPVSHYETQQRIGGASGSSGSAGWGPLTPVAAMLPGGAVGATGVGDHNDVQGTSIVDVGIGAGQTREYRVRAVNAAGVPGPWSFPVVGATSEGGKPSAPTGVRATPDGDTAIDVSWAPPQDDGGSPITRYEVQWSEDGEAENGWRRLGYASAGAALTIKQGGLSETTERHYRVRGENSAGWGPWSEPVMATTRTGVPDAPGSFRAGANGSTEIVLTWTEPYDGGEAISYYDLEWSPGSSGPWSDLATVAVDTTEYADKGPAAGDKRYYRVRARNFNGAGAWSATRSATTTANAPAAPTNLMARPDGENAINLSWGVPDGNGSAITGYRVERSRDGQAPWELLRSSGTSTTYRDTDGLYRGMTRHYRVAARNSAGWGEWSEVASGTTAGEPAPPPGWVDLLRFTSVGSNSVGLTWSAPVEEGVSPVTGYEYQVLGPNGPEEVKKTTGTSVSIGGLNIAGDYIFSVRAINAVGGGPWEDLIAHMNPSGSGSVTVSRTSLTVTEGSSASYNVRLGSNPPLPVLLNVGTPWFTGMSFTNEDEVYGVVLAPSGWTKPEGCAALDRYTFRSWNQGVTVELAIEDDDMDTGDEVGVFTHEVFPLPPDELCIDEGEWNTAWGVDYDNDDFDSPSAYHPYRVGPGTVVTRRDND